MCQIQVDTHSKIRVQIPARDYDIDRSEVDILCRYSNSRAPGDLCRLQASNQEPTLELHSRATPSVEAHDNVNGTDTGRNSRGRKADKKNIRHLNLSNRVPGKFTESKKYFHLFFFIVEVR